MLGSFLVSPVCPSQPPQLNKRTTADPVGILEPNQLFFRSSHSNLITLDGVESDIITGDVLITRDPCRLPTDVQKVRSPPTALPLLSSVTKRRLSGRLRTCSSCITSEMSSFYLSKVLDEPQIGWQAVSPFWFSMTSRLRYLDRRLRWR